VPILNLIGSVSSTKRYNSADKLLTAESFCKGDYSMAHGRLW